MSLEAFGDLLVYIDVTKLGTRNNTEDLSFLFCSLPFPTEIFSHDERKIDENEEDLILIYITFLASILNWEDKTMLSIPNILIRSGFLLARLSIVFVYWCFLSSELWDSKSCSVHLAVSTHVFLTKHAQREGIMASVS